MHDPIADMLTRIRNGQARSKITVNMPSSKLKVAIAKVLHEEGYINGYKINEDANKKVLTVELRYFEGKPVIEKLERASKPSLRKYRSNSNLPKVIGGFGTVIVSTSKGVMTDRSARAQRIGGELLCFVE
jgi:small subunit ribosomal protein S8